MCVVCVCVCTTHSCCIFTFYHNVVGDAASRGRRERGAKGLVVGKMCQGTFFLIFGCPKIF